MAKTETPPAAAIPDPDGGMALVRATPEELALAYDAVLNGATLPASADPEAMSREIAERLRAADTFDAVFTPQTLRNWATDFRGEAVYVKDVRLNRSTKEGRGPSVYAVVDIVTADDGEAVTVQTGGQNVLVQLLKIVEHRWTDRPFRMVAKQAGSGNEVLWLEPA